LPYYRLLLTESQIGGDLIEEKHFKNVLTALLLFAETLWHSRRHYGYSQ